MFIQTALSNSEYISSLQWAPQRLWYSWFLYLMLLVALSFVFLCGRSRRFGEGIAAGNGLLDLRHMSTSLCFSYSAS